MAKFTIYAVNKITYKAEIEAKTANEAEEMYWESENEGIEVGRDFILDEIQDEKGEVVHDWNKEY